MSKAVCEVSCRRFLDGRCRPVEVDSNQSEALFENNQHYVMREIADILKISKSIKLLVKMKNVSSILRKKTDGLFGQPSTIFTCVEAFRKNYRNILHFCSVRQLAKFYYNTQIDYHAVI